jgi:pimeloyl-ACP methyl ester carboxylesterase
MNLETITAEPVSDVDHTPLLFVHGMWHAAWCWAEHFLPYFAQHGYPSHALSLRAHGGSEGRDRLRWISMGDYVSDVVQIVGQMERAPVLVGHSMGGMVVQKYLEFDAAPAAVLLASAPPNGLIPATLRVAARHPLTFLKVSLTMSLAPVVCTPQLAQEAFFSSDAPDEKVRHCFNRLQDESFRAYLDMMGLNLPRPSRVETPFLVLGAADDNLISPTEVEATAQAYGTTAHMFPDTAHDMMLEDRWELVAEHILSWLDEQGL